LLREAGVQTVRGNHDRWFFAAGYDRLPHFTSDEEIAGADRLWLASLPPVLRLHTARGPLLLCHGLGSDDMAGVLPHDQGYALDANHRLHALVGAAEYRFIVNGHTHRRMVRTFDGLTILNGGTLRSDHQPCICVADFEAGAARCYNLSDDTAKPRIQPAEIFALPLARSQPENAP
jgi:predicted phosphodiesterase